VANQHIFHYFSHNEYSRPLSVDNSGYKNLEYQFSSPQCTYVITMLMMILNNKYLGYNLAHHWRHCSRGRHRTGGWLAGTPCR
jgi:hypothetical protein